TLRARKARSALTVLGIVIGVTSVISVAGIIDGLNGFVKARIASVGSRLFIVTRMPFGSNPFRLPQKVRLRRFLQFEDAAFLRDAFPAVAYATVFADRINLGLGNNNFQNDIRYGKRSEEHTS